MAEGNQWQQVTCARCKRSYQCTPEDDYYGYPPDAPMPGPEDGYCFACLLALNGMDADQTQVRVIDGAGAEWDPRDAAVRENFEAEEYLRGMSA